MGHSITKEQLERVESGKVDITDPCVICGFRFNSIDCTHTVEETAIIFNTVQSMSLKDKNAIRGEPAVTTR